MHQIPLLLGSSSTTRHAIMRSMDLPYVVINHTSPEVVMPDVSPEQIPLFIAQHKMETLIMPHDYAFDTAFCITADTLSLDTAGTVYGKPTSKQEAISFIQKQRGVTTVYTALCVERRERDSQAKHVWHTTNTQQSVVRIVCEWYIPDDQIETYLIKTPHAMHACGAFVVEGFGAQYVKSIQGSYTGLLGLPAFELRGLLEKIGY